MTSNKGKLFGTLCDGEFEIRSLTENDLEKAIDVLNKSFYLNESVCRGTLIDLPQSQDARDELSEMCRVVAKDGCSIIAKHLPTNQVVGVAFNKIQCLDNSQNETFFEEFMKKCKTPNTKELIDYMIVMDNKFNVFEYYKINCLMEITFLSTLQEYGRRGIANALVKYSIELAKNLSNNQDHDLLNDRLKNKCYPKALSAIFTSIYSQKIGDKLGMEFLLDVPYTEFKYDGKTYAERIGPKCPSGILYAIKI